MFLVGGDFSHQRQTGVEAQMSDGDEGCVFDEWTKIQLTKDAALVAHIVEQDDLTVCRNGATEVLPAK